MDQGTEVVDRLESRTLRKLTRNQGLLAVPFVLHSQPTAVYHEESAKLAAVATATHQRYAEIMRDVEFLINDHSKSSSNLFPNVATR